jgi:hypothetical protein
LERRLKAVKDVSPLHVFGIVPVSWLIFTPRLIRFRLPNDAGSDPEKELLETEINCRAGKLPSDEGRLPVKLLLLIPMYVRLLNVVPDQDGSVPDRKLPPRLRARTVERPATRGGRVPTSLLNVTVMEVTVLTLLQMIPKNVQ